VHGRQSVRLGDDQQRSANQSGPQTRRKLGERLRLDKCRPILFSQDPESRPALDVNESLLATGVNDVATESQEDKIAVAQPLEQLLNFLDFGSTPRHGELGFFQVCANGGQLPEHGMEVFRCLPQQPKVFFHLRTDFFGLLRRKCPI